MSSFVRPNPTPENCVIERTSFFKEYDTVVEQIASLKACSTTSPMDVATHAVARTFGRYLGYPELLDPRLKSLVDILTSRVLEICESPATPILSHERHCLFHILYSLTNLRGPKKVLRACPHAVGLTHTLWKALNDVGSGEWESRYFLFLWLSLVLLNPFELGKVVGPEVKIAFVEVGRSSLSEPGKVSRGASVFLSRVLSRPDMVTELGDFLRWGKGILSSRTVDARMASVNELTKLGVLMTLVGVLKVGRREEISVCQDDFWSIVQLVIGDVGSLGLGFQSKSTLMRKMFVQLVQRVGLLGLPQRIVAWRYQKTRNVFMGSIASSSDDVAETDPGEGEEEDEEEDIGEDEEERVEVVLGQLLTGLCDPNTVVRWSSAKGVGRIAFRLPKFLGDEVVEQVLSLFRHDRTDDHAWHGACLTIAELARRGLLLPERLPDVLPVVIDALQFDCLKGTHSVGSNVRDSACYVCWSFARAYSPKLLRPLLKDIYPALITMAVFDREVNCRRAASAAFQENVGRAGDAFAGDESQRKKFIDLVGKVSYFTLSNLKNSYLEISVFAAQFNEFVRPLLNHLYQAKVIHWSKEVRRLAALALRKLAPRDFPYVRQVVLPHIVAGIIHEDPSFRHGRLVALCELLQVVSLDVNEDASLVKSILDLVPKMQASRLCGERGNEEDVQEAICHFIAGLSLSDSFSVEMVGPELRAQLQKLIDRNLADPNEDVIRAARNCFVSFCRFYGESEESEEEGEEANRTSLFWDSVASNYIRVLRASPLSKEARRGYLLALGAIPARLVNIQLFKSALAVFPSHIETREDPEERDVESRRNAVIGMTDLCLSCRSLFLSDQWHVEAVFEHLLKALQDDGVDRRGDVGSWVRIASMIGFQQLFDAECAALVDDPMKLRVACGLLKECVSRIDKMRTLAWDVLIRLRPLLPEEAVDGIVPEESEIPSDSLESDRFARVMIALSSSHFQDALVEGLCPTVGGIAPNRECKAVLLRALKADESLRIAVLYSMLRVMKKNFKMTKLIVPLLGLMLLLLQEFDDDVADFCKTLFPLIGKEMRGTKSIQKLKAGADVCAVLIKVEEVRKRAMNSLFWFLVNRFPIVRQHAGDQLFTALQTYGDEFIDDEDALDDIIIFLDECQWVEQDFRAKRETLKKLVFPHL